MLRSSAHVAAFIALMSACTTEPRPAPLLHVVNPTCESGPCVSFAFRIWPGGWAVPCPVPGCWRDLATVTSDSCIQLPTKLQLWRLYLDSQGRVDDSSVVATWTPNMVLGISAWAADTDVWEADFVPGNAAGWEVTLPDTMGDPPQAARPCKP